MSLNKKSLIQKTIHILSNLDIPPVSDENNILHGKVFVRDGICIGMRGDAIDCFEEIIEEISRGPGLPHYRKV
jgi:hypothetical protein